VGHNCYKNRIGKSNLVISIVVDDDDDDAVRDAVLW